MADRQSVPHRNGPRGKLNLIQSIDDGHCRYLNEWAALVFLLAGSRYLDDGTDCGRICQKKKKKKKKKKSQPLQFSSPCFMCLPSEVVQHVCHTASVSVPVSYK